MVTVNKELNRRDFLKLAGGGVAAGMAVIVVGNKLKWLSGTSAFAQGVVPAQSLVFRIQDAIKGMVTDQDYVGLPGTARNVGKCYFWIYKSVAEGTPATGVDIPAECPGPTVIAENGQTIHIKVYNDLDEPHAFYIPGMVDSATNGTVNYPNGIPANGGVWEADFVVGPPGAHLYYDNLNAPVNRVMGLHGALVVMPEMDDRTAGHKLTPYGALPANNGVQVVYDQFGSEAFPGLAWEEGDARPWSMNLGPNGAAEAGFMPLAAPGLNRVNCPPTRQYVWLDHQASPRLFAEVGSLPSEDGTGRGLYNPQEFMDKFLRDGSATFAERTAANIKKNNQANIVGGSNISYLPQYFTINGQSGMFAHFNPTVTPIGRVGEPVVVHILNAGLWTHSMHLHANHMWVTSVSMVNGPLNVNPNPIWVDVYRIDPMTRVDYTIPYMKPPDIGQPKGIGPYIPQEPALQTQSGHAVWPPIEELDMYYPAHGTKGKHLDETDCELGQRQSPLCYPMHDHSEPSQTAQGGNYNNGLISGIYFTGDRRGVGPKAAADPYLPAGDVQEFPMDGDFWMGNQNIRGIDMTGIRPAAPPMGEIM